LSHQVQFLQTGKSFSASTTTRWELFSFLASNMADIDTNKNLITTQGIGVLCFNRQDVSALSPCTHEKADIRLLLHVQDAVQQGYSKVSIRTVDTNVVVLAIASASLLSISELWISFGARKSFRFVAAGEIAKAVGPDRQWPCRCFMPSLVVTRCPLFAAGARRLHGTPGPPTDYTETSHQHSPPWVPC